MSYGIGPEENEGTRWTTNFQPLIPADISKDWFYISRPIIPIISQTNIGVPNETHNGLGDIIYGGYFGKRGHSFNWGAGPALSLPVGTDKTLSSKKWQAGPTAIVNYQKENITLGFLAIQLWSFAGDSERPEQNLFFFQPYFIVTDPRGYALGLLMDDYYNWMTDKWFWSVNPYLQKVFKWGDQPVSVSIGPRFFSGPENVTPDSGWRLTLSWIFPKQKKSSP